MFTQFALEVIRKMNPYDPIQHNPNSVLVMDNCRIHKDPIIIETAREK